ncbi:AAA family ATPase [Agrococcus carbonis]|uniref:Pilus assembly protein CpaE n=1 Tax=Agrococcus carbonis TaxID=684552 RepID=A0A1H1S684_9MICO|nr:AAA family ATPase [Agrococcus carbonis]SDS42769.1 pilus assembly protein CpaE [Agrococcus carbonis]
MSNVLLTSDSADLRSKVLEAAEGRCIALPGHTLPSEPADLLAQLQHESLPDVIVIDASRAAEPALALAARLDAYLPGTAVMLLGDPRELAMPAMRAGVRDVLAPEVDVAALRAALERAASAAIARRAPSDPSSPGGRAPARVISVLSPKGGAGKTTVATNLAIGLAELVPGGVVLVDLDLQFGDVATALAMEPEFTLDAIVQGPALRDPIALKTQLAQHSSGLYVIAAPEDPAAAEAVDAGQVGSLVGMLASQFRFVVLDTAAGLEPRTLSALDHTTDPVMLTTFDVPGVRGLRKEIATLRELGMLPGSRQVLLNFADPKGGLSVADVEATIRSAVDITIPFSRAVTHSLNTGEPLLMQRPGDPVAKQLRKLLAAYVAPPTGRGRKGRR